jgi:hypothetical protein
MEALKRRIKEVEGHRFQSAGRNTSVRGGALEDAEEDLYGAADDTGRCASSGDRDTWMPESMGPAEGSGTEALVAVRQEDFLVALRNLMPSLSAEEVQKYERLRDHYQGGIQK